MRKISIYTALVWISISTFANAQTILNADYEKCKDDLCAWIGCPDLLNEKPISISDVDLMTGPEQEKFVEQIRAFDSGSLGKLKIAMEGYRIESEQSRLATELLRQTGGLSPGAYNNAIGAYQEKIESYKFMMREMN